MDKIKNRFYLLGLSLLVLIIALTGLLGILDILPKPDSSPPPGENGKPSETVKPDDSESQAPSEQAPEENKPGPGQSSGNESQPGTQPSGISANGSGFTVSLPESFNTQASAALSPGLSLETPMPPHIPVLEVTGAGDTAYLKSFTSSFFNGDQWESEDLTLYDEYNGETLSLPDVFRVRQELKDHITVSPLAEIADGTVSLPTSEYPVSVDSPLSLLYSPELQTFLSEAGFPESYSFDTIHYVFSNTVLANAELDLVEKYLQLPDDITQRTRDLAEEIVSGIESPYLMAKAIEDYLETSCVYDFDYEFAPEGWEPNDWFIFEEKSGVCVNFNSAFVVLCRAAGIPARLVGGFAITPQDKKQVVYADQGHAWSEVKFKELGWSTFDATGSAPGLLPTVTGITAAGPVTRKGHEFPVQGTVLTTTGAPAEGTMVEIFINDRKDPEGAVLIGKGIVSGGRYEIQASIPESIEVGDYHLLAHSLESVRYLESWSDPLIKVVTATKLNLEADTGIKVTEAFSLTGTLTEEFGGVLAGQEITVYLNDEPVKTLVTDKSGRFAWQQVFNDAGTYNIKVGFAGTEYYLESVQETALQVLSPTNIELNVEGSADAGGATVDKPVEITGRLTEEMTGNPLAGRGIDVFIDGIPLDINITTDSQGRFDFKHVFDKIGDHRVEVKFAEDSDYSEAKSEKDVKVTPPSGFSPWTIVIAVLAVAAAGVGGWFLYRWLSKRPASPAAAPGKEEKEIPAPPPPPHQESSDPALSLTIELPQIIEPFPDVWGAGDKLDIVCRLLDSAGGGFVAKPLEVYINNEPAASLKTGTDGAAGLDHTFADKGQYEIAVKFEESQGERKAAAYRTVRIVDYREEIVSLFDALVDGFREMDIEISEEATPREIEKLVLGAKMGIPEQALDITVSCFEETDYSLHPIARRHYEIMYMAQREIKEHGAKPARAAA